MNTEEIQELPQENEAVEAKNPETENITSEDEQLKKSTIKHQNESGFENFKIESDRETELRKNLERIQNDFPLQSFLKLIKEKGSEELAAYENSELKGIKVKKSALPKAFMKEVLDENNEACEVKIIREESELRIIKNNETILEVISLPKNKDFLVRFVCEREVSFLIQLKDKISTELKESEAKFSERQAKMKAAFAKKKS